jgi:rRNA-processing protein FCF1
MLFCEQVLLDGTFIFTAFKYKLDIAHRLEGLLQETSLKLYVLQSSIEELKAVGAKAELALEWTMRCCESIDDRKHNNLEPVQKMVTIIGFIHLLYENIPFSRVSV